MAKQGKNQDDISQLNRSLIMRLIHRMGVCSRTELARQSGLTNASVTGIVQQLIAAGVVEEVGLIGGNSGRRSIGLSLSLNKYLCVGIRLTRKHILGGLFDISGELYASEQREIMANSSPKDAMKLMKEIITKLLEQADSRQVLGIGIALPGPIIYKEEKIAYMSAFPGWENISIKEELSAAFDLPVLLEHDGVCFALSEWWNQGSEDYGLMLCVLVGQGVGAGIIKEGRPIRGAMGCAGEIGHMSMDPFGERCDCGNCGCMEKYSSLLALEKMMRAELKHHPEHPLYGTEPEYHQILPLVQAGDPLSVELFTRAAQYLGYALVNLINFLNPDVVVVTDDMAVCDKLMQSVLESVLTERLSPRILAETRLIVRPNNSYQAMQAATSLIMDRFLSQPVMLPRKSS